MQWLGGGGDHDHRGILREYGGFRAYFAKLLGLPFIAVVPRSTSREKIAQIEFYGGRAHLVDSAGEIYAASRQLAADTNGLVSVLVAMNGLWPLRGAAALWHIATEGSFSNDGEN